MLETRFTIDVQDAERPSAGSGKSGMTSNVESAVWGRSWCSGEVRVSLVKPEYNDTVVSNAPKCSGMTESRHGQNQPYCHITDVKQWVKFVLVHAPLFVISVR